MNSGRKDYANKPLKERFEEKFKINTDSGCWEWQRYLNSDGYGRFHYIDKDVLAHRMSYILYNGEIPKGRVLVCHTCDNPKCVNPKHLFLGSDADNIHDSQNKSRRKVAECPSYTRYNAGCRCELCVSFYIKKERYYYEKREARKKLKKLCGVSSYV